MHALQQYVCVCDFREQKTESRLMRKHRHFLFEFRQYFSSAETKIFLCKLQLLLLLFYFSYLVLLNKSRLLESFHSHSHTFMRNYNEILLCCASDAKRKQKTHSIHSRFFMLLFYFIEVGFIWSFIKIQNIFFAVSSGFIILIIVSIFLLEKFITRQNRLFTFFVLVFVVVAWNREFSCSRLTHLNTSVFDAHPSNMKILLLFRVFLMIFQLLAEFLLKKREENISKNSAA